MRFFVLGATGGIGAAFVSQALARGDEVTAFVRSPERLPHHPRLVARRGNPRRTAEQREALGGHDVVISALGRRDKTDRTLLADCARSTLEAMRDAGVKRLIVVSSALLFPDIGLLGTLLRRYVFAAGLADSREMERLIEGSDRDWTVVRPPRLVDGPPSAKVRVADDHLPRGSRSIARVDVARFLLDEAGRDEHVRRIVGVCG